MENQNLIQSDMADELRIEGINFKGYGIIPKFAMLDTSLSIEAKGIYAYFCSYAGAGDTAFPGWSKIVSDLKINKDSYYKHYKLLLENGYLAVQQQNAGGRGQGFSKNIYTIISNPPKFNSTPDENNLQKTYSIIRSSGLKAAGYGFIAKAVMTDQRLSLKAKALYAYFCSFSGAGDSACPKKDVILHHLQISSNSFIKYNKELTNLNYINVVQHLSGGRLSVNEYVIVDNPDITKAQAHRIDNNFIQDTKISESQISETVTKPHTKFSESQKQDTQKQELQNSEAKNNKIKNNKKNNNNLDKQQCISAALEEDWDDEKLFFEILKEGNIPEYYLENPQKLEAAVKLICNYKKYSNKHLYEKFENGEFQYSAYMLFVDALISMLSNPKERKIDDRSVTNETIREKLARYIETTPEGNLGLDTLIVETRSLYEDAAKVTQPKRPLNFMQRMIWNAMINGTIMTDALLIHDFDEETGETF